MVLMNDRLVLKIRYRIILMWNFGGIIIIMKTKRGVNGSSITFSDKISLYTRVPL